MQRIALSALVIFAAIITVSAQQTTSQQVVAAAANAMASASRPQPRRLATIRTGDATEGSRVIVTSDATLSDYQAYADGGRFYVLIPYAVEPKAQNELRRGRGFTDVEIERRGEDVLLSFGLEAGTQARVSQRFNRLEVLFAVASQQEGAAQISTASATPTPTPAPAAASSPAPVASPSPVVVAPETKSPSESTPAATVPATNAASPQTAKAPGVAASTVAGITLPPEKASPVRLSKFEKPPVIDGKLDDAVWQNANVLKDFYQIDPGDNTPPLKPTEVLLGYDAKFLYIAFRCFDEPDKVRATIAKRDNIFSDDYVGFFLDTFNDQRKAFEAFFNPLGIQADGVLTEGRGEDFSVDWVMESKGLVNQEGYIVEIAIPFKSLRYAVGKDKLWGAHFFRRIKRNNNELDSWMPFSRSNSSNLAQQGHLSGLEGISTERQLELIPSLTVSQTGRSVRSLNPPIGVPDPGRIVNQPVELEPGLTAKFGITPTSTLDLALNPDFAQVEADQIVVTTNQRFPIFFPEKRPFFLEGIDIFQTPILAVHTRTIVDPDIAIKFSGKEGRNTYGIMVASDNGPGNLSLDDRGALNNCFDRRLIDPAIICNNERFVDKNAYIGVLRLKRDIGKGDSTIGLLATTYNFIEKHNQLGGFDGRFRINKQTTFDIQVLGTTSRNFFYNPETDETRYRTGNGFAYTTQYDVSGRNWGWQLYGEGFTQDYRADVGFFGRQNTNFNSFYVRYNTDPKPKAKKIISTHYHNFSWIGYDFQGRIQNWESEFYVEWRLKRNSWFSLAWEPAYERILEEEFGPRRSATRQGAFYGEDNERSVQKNHFFIAGGSQFNKKIQFNGRAVWRLNHLDLDFGGGRRFPRISPSALARRTCLEEGIIDPVDCPADPLDPGAGNLFEFSGAVTYQPTNELKLQLNYIKNRLVRKDTGFVASDTNIFTLRSTYQFTPFTFARAIVDYNTLNQRVRGQFLLGWTPNPGTAFYAGYNDDLNYGFNPISREIVPGFRRNGRTFFIKMSYLFRKSF